MRLSRDMVCGCIAAALVVWSGAAARADRMVTQSVPSPAPLVGYYPFDDGPGSTTAANLVSGGNTGTLQNLNPATAWQAGAPALPHSSHSLAFPGGQFNSTGVAGVDIFGASPANWLNTASPFSISLWMRANASAFNDGDAGQRYPLMMTLNHNAGGDGFHFFLARDSLAGSYAGMSFGSTSSWGRFGAAALNNATTVDGDWHHVVLTYDGTGSTNINNFDLFFDGVQQTLQANSGGYATLGGTILGAGTGNVRLNWDGNLDDVAIFSAVLTPEQIAFLAGGGDPLFTQPPVPLAPEPGTLLLFALVGVLGGWHVWRQRRV